MGVFYFGKIINMNISIPVTYSRLDPKLAYRYFFLHELGWDPAVLICFSPYASASSPREPIHPNSCSNRDNGWSICIHRSVLQPRYLYINLACLSDCLSVCLYPINVKTAEPIGSKFFVGHLGTPGKVYEWLKF